MMAFERKFQISLGTTFHQSQNGEDNGVHYKGPTHEFPAFGLSLANRWMVDGDMDSREAEARDYQLIVNKFAIVTLNLFTKGPTAWLCHDCFPVAVTLHFLRMHSIFSQLSISNSRRR